jgi:NTE family protein
VTAAAARAHETGAPRVGLALGGGGARGFAHIPVLEALDELGIRPAVIAGTSIGAIMGAGYASGMTAVEIRDYSIALFRKRSEVLGKLWSLRPKLLQGAVNFAQFDAERVIDKFLPKSLPEEFSGLSIPLRLLATDFYGWHETVLREGNLRRAIAASVAIPVLFRPVVLDGRVFVDGGITNPLPFDHAGDDVDIVIAVDVIGGPVAGGHARLPSSTEAMFGAAQLFMQAVTREKLRSCRPPDILLRTPPNSFRVLDFMKVPAILKSAEPLKDDLKRQLDRVLAGERQLVSAARSS